MIEKNYDFRTRHWQVHKPNRRDPDRKKLENELLIEDGWAIGCAEGVVMENAVKDLQDYFWTSMGVSVGRAGAPGKKVIWLTTGAPLDRGFFLHVEEDRVLIQLAKDANAFCATVYLEDVMNLEGAPVLPLGQVRRRPLYDHRSVHAGADLDNFTDAELLATAHAGYDAVVLFVKDFDKTTKGYCNINDVIQRAKRFGLGVIMYNYINAFIHPEDANADEVFDATYGEIFRRYPDLMGISLVGESLEYPSKDPRTTGKKYYDSVIDGIPDTRPSPGFFPCSDYPAYLEGIRKAVHNVKKDALLIFGTTCWGYLPPEERRSFLEHLPKGYTVLICYETFSPHVLEGLRTPVMDYTMMVEKPGGFFKSEAIMCKELGIPVEGNVNTTGVAWDFGCVPYVPTPGRLLNRMRSLRVAHKEWGVTSHYATHHFGWSSYGFASDLGKWSAWDDFEPDYDELLRKIAVRDYGKAAAPHVLKAWKYWDQALDHYVASNDDQYGPWRTGPSYPFIFQPNITRTMLGKEIQFPTAPHAHFGHTIIMTLYQPYENTNQAPAFLRYPAELRSLERMEKLWLQGMEEAKLAGDSENGARLNALSQFILCSTRTVMNIKKWWFANMKLQLAADQAEAFELLDQIEAIALREMDNARACIPAVETDSRIGWEPSMEYVCDRWHLEWKLRQMESALREVGIYRSIVENAYADAQ